MRDQIGAMAGQVWQRLQQGPTTVSRLKTSVGGSPELLNQAIGWLAREDKLQFEMNGKSLKISLK